MYHNRDAEDAMSESSRWSGETEIPEKYVWFQKILDNDVSEEVEHLKNEDEQWRNNSMWHKGSYEDTSQSSSKPVDAKTFKTYDHRRHLAYSHKKALIRAEIMSEAVNDIYRAHKMQMNKERTFTFEYDKEDDKITEGVVQWKRKHGQPISLLALSANQCKGVKWLMDTGCGHYLVGKSKAASLGVDIVQDKDDIVFQTANGTTSTSDSIKYYVNELKEAVQPSVLDETPTVLSTGRRCMKIGYSFHWICWKLPFMITHEKEIVHLHVKSDIPYLVGDRNARSNRHRPVSEDILEHMKMLKEINGIERDGDEAEVEEEEVGEPQYALAGEEDGVEAVDFGPPGGAGPAPPRVEEPGEEARGRGPEPGEDEAEGEDDADPEAGIEFDIKKRIGTLKDDANSLTHLLTHRYRNPFCESCVKAKMRHFRSKPGAF